MQGKTRLPSLRAVEIFVAAGRALSFTAAAQAVNLTPSAVSRRIRDLERELGTPLFRRFNRRVELTRAGARFLDAAGQAIDLIEYETATLRPQRDGRTLRLSALQSLASTWLLPRLAVLQRRRPDVEVQIETSAELADLIRGPFDAAIRFGEGNWPGLSAERLFETHAFAVAAPAHWPCGASASPAALDRATLLGVVHIPDLWPQYLAGLGMAGYRPRRVQTFDNVHVMHEAAANGLGLALTVRELVGEQLVAGRLEPAFSNPPVPLRQGYYLVCRKDRHREPALRALRGALFDCAELI
ncbi:MAG TPA: LysR substrate-binding domain-containing protein [Stellaceae bacterium]|jgi:LysR family glycine cleavage system transcriptional activator